MSPCRLTHPMSPCRLKLVQSVQAQFLGFRARGFRGHILLAFAVKSLAFAVNFLAFAVKVKAMTQPEPWPKQMPRSRKDKKELPEGEFHHFPAGQGVSERVEYRQQRADSRNMKTQTWMARSLLKEGEGIWFHKDVSDGLCH